MGVGDWAFSVTTQIYTPTFKAVKISQEQEELEVSRPSLLPRIILWQAAILPFRVQTKNFTLNVIVTLRFYPPPPSLTSNYI